MAIHRIARASLASAAFLMAVQPAFADDGLVGGIIGGIIGGVIVNEATKNRSQKKTTSTRSYTQPSYSPQREANREVQVALNYFGYPVGTPDGSIGPRSRSAISQYQAFLGYPATGQLTEYERTILVGAYYRGVAGGSQVAQIMATSPQGTRGLLLNQRDEMAGVATQSDGSVAAAQEPEPVLALPVLVATPEPEAPAAPALPSFLGGEVMQVSLASQCNKISLMTNTNGGYVTEAAMTDANFALGEQFCLARTYAMAEGEQLAGAVKGFTPAQIAEQCKGFGPALKDQVSALSLKPRDEVLKDVSAFVVGSGMAPAQLAGTAKICLGVGYTTDAMDVAIGSALLLTALGENGYSELLGHHLSQGFGATVRPDLSLAWYEAGIEADKSGKAVFAPGLPDRIGVIRKAAYTINGRTDLGSDSAILPVFALTVEPEVVPQVAAPAASDPAEVAIADTAATPAATPAAIPVSPIGAAAQVTSTVFSVLGGLVKN